MVMQNNKKLIYLGMNWQFQGGNNTADGSFIPKTKPEIQGLPQGLCQATKAANLHSHFITTHITI